MTWSHATMLLATVSFSVNGVAAWHRFGRGLPFDRAWAWCYSSIAALSAFYTGAFVWLLEFDADRKTWSEFLTPFSALSFFLVWIVPAGLAYQEHQTLHKER